MAALHGIVTAPAWTPRPTAPAPSTLLDHATLVMQQVTGSMPNDFDILDATGERAVGHVTTTGSGVARFFSGARSLYVADADGTPLLLVEDPPGIGVDRFELSAPDRTPVAELRSSFSVLATKVGMTLADGAELELHGDMLGLDYEFRYGEAVATRAAREWACVGGDSSVTAGACSASIPRCRRLCTWQSSAPASCWT